MQSSDPIPATGGKADQGRLPKVASAKSLSHLMPGVPPNTPVAPLKTAERVTAFNASSPAALAGRLGKSIEIQPDAFDFEGMNLAVGPGKDFYQFAVGGWLKEAQIPAGHPCWGAFHELRQQTTKAQQGILEEKGGHLCQVHYRSGIDMLGRNEAGLAPLQGLLALIGGIKEQADISRVTGELWKYGLDPFFSWWVSSHPTDDTARGLTLGCGGLTLPDYEMYDPACDTEANKHKEKRAAYEAYVVRMFELQGCEDAQSKAAHVLQVEKELAQVHLRKEDRRDSDKTTHVIREPECRNFDWKQMCGAVGINPEWFNVRHPPFFRRLGQLTEELSPEIFRDYMQFRLVHMMAPRLSQEYVDAHFDLFSKTLRGVQEPRPLEERVADQVGSDFGHNLGKLYVERHFSVGRKEQIEEWVGLVKAALIERIGVLNWMQPETKARAIAKVEAMVVQIGYPEKGYWQDDSGVELSGTDSYAANTLVAHQFEVADQLSKVGTPLDKKECSWAPQVVNAYNSPTQNKVIFPAAILQHPFVTNDPAVTFGAMMMVIGHEIIHSFDDSGRKYDLEGKKADWWLPEDKAAYEAHAKVVEDQFNAYAVEFKDGTSQKVNGKMCLGENLADLGGLHIAFAAFQRFLETNPLEPINGYTPEQRFFLGYAQVWRFISEDAAAQSRLQSDPHSPAEWRVKGPLSHMEEFRQAWGLPEECPMMRPKGQRSTMWTASQ